MEVNDQFHTSTGFTFDQRTTANSWTNGTHNRSEHSKDKNYSRLSFKANRSHHTQTSTKR
jgi:hypothetical protein